MSRGGPTLVDAGPLVALIHQGDRHHQACCEALRSLRGPMLTVWPSFTEAMYLLGFSWRAQDALWQFLHRRALRLVPLDERDEPRMRALMSKYRDLPMDLADAGLVRAAERERIGSVFTVDQSHFRIYRPRGLDSFELLPEAL